MNSRIRTSLQSRRANGGFTLVETLVALIILVIMTGIVAMGIPMAFNTYSKAVDGSNAQVLLSTTTAELRNEFGLAQDVKLGNDGTVEYYLTGDGYWASLQSVENSGIVKHVYLGREPGTNEDTTKTHMLVSAAAQTDSLCVQFSGISYSNGTFTVSGLKVVRKTDEEVLADIGAPADGTYKVRSITFEEGR